MNCSFFCWTWSFEEPSVFVGCSQVVVTVGIGLCQRPVLKHAYLCGRTLYLLNKGASQVGSDTSLAFVCSDAPGSTVQPHQQWLGSHLGCLHASDGTFSFLSIATYYISWVFSEPRRKDDPEVENMSGAWKTRKKGGFFIPQHLQSRLLGWNAFLFGLVFFLTQMASFVWPSTYPL